MRPLHFTSFASRCTLAMLACCPSTMAIGRQLEDPSSAATKVSLRPASAFVIDPPPAPPGGPAPSYPVRTAYAPGRTREAISNADNHTRQLPQETEVLEHASPVQGFEDTEGYLERDFDVQDGCCENSHCHSSPCEDGLPLSCMKGRFWGRAEYLMWWTQGASTPPLITTGTSQTAANAGVLGQPGTSILFGSGDLLNGLRSGGRFTVGTWPTPDHDLGVMAIYTFIGQQTASFDGSSQTHSILARPFFNVDTNAQDSVLIAFPNVVQGSVNAAFASQLDGCELLASKSLQSRCDRNLDFLFGYRYAHLNESLSISEFNRSLEALTQNVTTEVNESFATSNRFYGAEIGASASWESCRVYAHSSLKVAFGSSRGAVDINGSTVTTTPQGSSTTREGGLLTQASNIGHYSEDRFAVMPEIILRLGYYLTPNCRVHTGYTLLYWSQVARPGNQIDYNVDGSQVGPGPATGAFPQAQFQWTDFWAQGLTFGIDCSF